MPLDVFSLAALETNKKISKVCCKETQENGNKHILLVPGNIYLKNLINIQGKYPCESTFLNIVAGYLTLPANVFLELL